MELIDSLSLVPRLVDAPELGDFDDDARGYLTIDAAALQLIPFLGSGVSIDRIARRGGLARTLRKVAALVRAEAGGAVRASLYLYKDSGSDAAGLSSQL
jgi:hypothetical protein